MNKLESLKNVFLFSELDEKSLKELELITGIKKYKKTQVIFNEGDLATTLYILLDGIIDLIKYSSDGKEQRIRRVSAGEIFAEAAVFSGSQYPVTSIAKKETTLLYIEKNKFISFVKSHPNVALQMMGTMSHLLRHLNQKIGEISLSSVSSRLAKYILEEARKNRSDQFTLDIKKQDLAAELGTISETLSRAFKKFKEKGLIEINKKTIKIKSPTALKQELGDVSHFITT